MHNYYLIEKIQKNKNNKSPLSINFVNKLFLEGNNKQFLTNLKTEKLLIRICIINLSLYNLQGVTLKIMKVQTII